MRTPAEVRDYLRKRGRNGGKSRARKLSKARRSEIARMGGIAAQKLRREADESRPKKTA